MITKLHNFYLLDGKLLYVCKDFIGFNPMISKPLVNDTERVYDTKTKEDKFEIQGSVFSVLLTSFFALGPARGYEKIEILKNDRKIISYEYGGKGHGVNYSEGNRFLVENNQAYLTTQGNALRDKTTNAIYSDFVEYHNYFFWFENIIIPRVTSHK